MAKKNKNKKDAHRYSVLHSHEFSPMARRSVHKSKRDMTAKRDRREKQKGWQ